MKEFLQDVKTTVMDKKFLFGFIAGAVIVVGFITWNDAAQAALK